MPSRQVLQWAIFLEQLEVLQLSHRQAELRPFLAQLLVLVQLRRPLRQPRPPLEVK
jgi:heme A synthase